MHRDENNSDLRSELSNTSYGFDTGYQWQGHGGDDEIWFNSIGCFNQSTSIGDNFDDSESWLIEKRSEASDDYVVVVRQQ